MNTSKNLVFAGFVAALGVCIGVAAMAQPVARAGDDATAKTVAAAEKFFATLDEAQRGKLVFDFKDDDQRKRWSNLPVNSVPRAGLRMGDLTPPQREAALAVLAAALGPMGYEKVIAIVEADEALNLEDVQAPEGGGGG